MTGEVSATELPPTGQLYSPLSVVALRLMMTALI
jgi:hypothetical protein